MHNILLRQSTESVEINFYNEILDECEDTAESASLEINKNVLMQNHKLLNVMDRT